MFCVRMSVATGAWAMAHALGGSLHATSYAHITREVILASVIASILRNQTHISRAGRAFYTVIADRVFRYTSFTCRVHTWMECSQRRNTSYSPMQIEYARFHNKWSRSQSVKQSPTN